MGAVIMSYDTLAFIDGDNGRRYRVRKWNDKNRKRTSKPKQPHRIYVQDPETHEWNHLNWWNDGERFGLESDREVMEEALHRLETAFNVEPEKIVYDNTPVRMTPNQDVTIEAL